MVACIKNDILAGQSHTSSEEQRAVEVVDVGDVEFVPPPPSANWVAVVPQRTIRVLEALRNGAAGVVTEADRSADLAQSVQTASGGSPYLSPGATQLLVAWIRKPETRGVIGAPKLSGREREVLTAVAEGLSVKQTALRLGITHKTVEAHRTRAFSKLGVRNRQEALLILSDLGATT